MTASALKKETKVFTLNNKLYLDNHDYKMIQTVMTTAYFDIKNVTLYCDLELTTKNGKVAVNDNGITITTTLDEALPLVLTLHEGVKKLRKKNMLYGRPNKTILASKDLMKERFAYLNAFLKGNVLPYEIKVAISKDKKERITLYETVYEGQRKEIGLQQVSDPFVFTLLTMFFSLVQYKWDGLIIFIDKAVEGSYELFADFMVASYKIPIVIG